MAQGNPQDAVVQVAPDSTGAKIDNAQLVRDDGTVVNRQRIVIASDDNPQTQVDVRDEVGRGKLIVGGEAVELLRSIEISMKIIVTLLCLQFDADPDSLREAAINT